MPKKKGRGKKEARGKKVNQPSIENAANAVLPAYSDVAVSLRPCC
jgi:hypothetical protein